MRAVLVLGIGVGSHHSVSDTRRVVFFFSGRVSDVFGCLSWTWLKRKQRDVTLGARATPRRWCMCHTKTLVLRWSQEKYSPKTPVVAGEVQVLTEDSGVRRRSTSTHTDSGRRRSSHWSQEKPVLVLHTHHEDSFTLTTRRLLYTHLRHAVVRHVVVLLDHVVVSRSCGFSIMLRC